MTHEEIKKGLAFCKDAELCDGCPILGKCKADIIAQAHALVGRLEAQIPKWINVKERLPEKWHDEKDGTLINYLVYMPEYGVDVGNYLQPAERWVCMGIPCKVTHWMPLPEPPKVAKL